MMQLQSPQIRVWNWRSSCINSFELLEKSSIFEPEIDRVGNGCILNDWLCLIHKPWLLLNIFIIIITEKKKNSNKIG